MKFIIATVSLLVLIVMSGSAVVLVGGWLGP
jgi:hypothetical protein